MTRQFHFDFPSERAARTFVHLMAAGYSDIAILRDRGWVSIIDGGETDRRKLFLELALRVCGQI